jgi:hypothetical protein
VERQGDQPLGKSQITWPNQTQVFAVRLQQLCLPVQYMWLAVLEIRVRSCGKRSSSRYLSLLFVAKLIIDNKA